ncbi:MAG: MarR family transcriptional regulator [Lachnospiraceae bacterium]|nr:MarR family transcriptional regulator [Lachnospiraceae bacterium]
MKLKGITAEYLDSLAMQRDFTTMHYKIMLVLLSGKLQTQAQLAEKLGVKHRQNLTPPLNDLTKHGYITVDRTEGRNKFLKAVLNRPKVAVADDVDKGQLPFEDVAVIVDEVSASDTEK